MALQTPLWVKFCVVMQGNTAAKRQKSGNGSSVPTKKCVIKGAPPGENQGEKPVSSRSNIPPHYKMSTTIFLIAPIKIYELYLSTMETIEINLMVNYGNNGDPFMRNLHCIWSRHTILVMKDPVPLSFGSIWPKYRVWFVGVDVNDKRRYLDTSR